jgi:hypothetical protein
MRYSQSRLYDRASNTLMEQDRPVKTATDRAAEALEVAEEIFAHEMGATLGLSPAAKAVLIATIAAAIQVAVAERERPEQFVS